MPADLRKSSPSWLTTMTRVYVLLLSLTPEQRRCCELRFSGLTYGETAAILGKSEIAVRASFCRGLAALRDLMEDIGSINDRCPPVGCRNRPPMGIAGSRVRPSATDRFPIRAMALGHPLRPAVLSEPRIHARACGRSPRSAVRPLPGSASRQPVTQASRSLDGPWQSVSPTNVAPPRFR